MRKLGWLLGIFCSLILLGCGESSKEDVKTGSVIRYGTDPGRIELECDDGEYYGYIFDENTELVWEDRRLLEYRAEAVAKHGEWEVFRTCMKVAVEVGEETDTRMYMTNGKIKNCHLAKKVTVIDVGDIEESLYAKPVIYLYPEQEQQVTVKLDYQGRLTCTYPTYEETWKVTAAPDGTITDADGQVYNYLYWEGETLADYDFTRGFCIAGKDTAVFLEDALAKLGLNRKEANEFIVYWLPLMQENPYNIIAFQTDVYTEQAKLIVDPEPDTLIRVFMAWKSSNEFVNIPEQEFDTPKRDGFTVVEWGGSEMK